MFKGMTLFPCAAQLCFEFYPRSGDPNVTDVRENLFLVPGVTFRLTRNLDKDRGFVNGAVGVVRDVLKVQDGRPIVFTVEQHICIPTPGLLVHVA